MSSLTPRNPYLALAPWLALAIVTRYSTLQAGAAVALVAAVLVSLPSFTARRPKVLEIASIVAFAAFLAVAIATNPGKASFLFRYDRAIAAGLLAVIAFGSLLFVPFTEQYARETVPRELWNSPRFEHTNRLFTAAWGGVFALMAISHAIAGAMNTTRGETIFNWVIPILLVSRMITWMGQYRASVAEEPAAAVSAAR